MTDPDLEIPTWVVRMREAGFDVRMGTGDLPEEPEFAFTLPEPRHVALRRQVVALARRIWGEGKVGRARGMTGNASLP